MQTVLPELEKRSYVERYTWLGAGVNHSLIKQVCTSRLFGKMEDLTIMVTGTTPDVEMFHDIVSRLSTC